MQDSPKQGTAKLSVPGPDHVHVHAHAHAPQAFLISNKEEKIVSLHRH